MVVAWIFYDLTGLTCNEILRKRSCCVYWIEYVYSIKILNFLKWQRRICHSTNKNWQLSLCIVSHFRFIGCSNCLIRFLLRCLSGNIIKSKTKHITQRLRSQWYLDGVYDIVFHWTFTPYGINGTFSRKFKQWNQTKEYAHTENFPINSWWHGIPRSIAVCPPPLIHLCPIRLVRSTDLTD